MMKVFLYAALTVSTLSLFAQEKDQSQEKLTQYNTVDQVPIFFGCDSTVVEEERKLCFERSMAYHVAGNFVYPILAKQLKVQGKIFVNFVIERDGQVSDISVVRGLQSPTQDSIINVAARELEDECIRVIKLLPRFSPAVFDGKPSRMQFTMPINAKVR
jgi:protein TonB